MNHEASDKEMKAMQDILQLFIERDIQPNSSIIVLNHLTLCLMKAYSNEEGWDAMLRHMKQDWAIIEPAFTPIKREEYERVKEEGERKT